MAQLQLRLHFGIRQLRVVPEGRVGVDLRIGALVDFHRVGRHLPSLPISFGEGKQRVG